MFSANTSQVSDDKLFVEDVFSTYLYTGNGSTQTITNGIDLAGKGGLVWIKARSPGGYNNLFQDTNRGANNLLVSNSTAAAAVESGVNFQFSSNGFSQNNAFQGFNFSGFTYASWTFREAPKFFDVVTYTGDGTSNRPISHSLGVAPGFIVIKRTDNTSNWFIYHRSGGRTGGALNASNDIIDTTDTTKFNAQTFDPSYIRDTNYVNTPNVSGATYVAYLFANDETAEGIIRCGSYSGNGSATGPTVYLGWEPQWVMIKNASATGDWQIIDNMRGMPVGSTDATLQANLTSAETSVDYISPNATGFQITSTSSQVNTSAKTYIYIAIRRGPMRTPTSGTSVFSPDATPQDPTPNYSGGFPVDLGIRMRRNVSSGPFWVTRLLGDGYLKSSDTNAWASSTTTAISGIQDGFYANSTEGSAAAPAVGWMFRRAPSFFDVVCYTGTGSARTINHNLGVAPELWIVKNRSSTGSWMVGGSVLGSATADRTFMQLDLSKYTEPNTWTTPTTTTFGIGTAYQSDSSLNASGNNYVAYLFASCPGVSKVGSYTGNGSSQTINCGFAAGARFVMIKRTDDRGDWYVWDSARGIVAGNDPRLSLNSTAAEVTTDDSVDTDSSGFVVNQLSATNINVSSATYIYLAVA